jgi:hypothetical protein
MHLAECSRGGFRKRVDSRTHNSDVVFHRQPGNNNMTPNNAPKASRPRSRFLALLVMGAAFAAPFAANADDHHPPHHGHRHQVCHNARVRDHHGHYHTQRQCHWVNR